MFCRGLSFPFETPDPFLFCVYHKDFYPKGDGNMQAPRTGNGSDFDAKAPYRMYHGEGRIPGFPQHPHRGFETITCTIQGYIDHADSLGNCGRYGHGDVQWMTAGKGISHSEMFPLINNEKENTLELYQIWLNLPSINKMADPCFVMHWAENMSILEDKGGRLRVWAGSIGDKKGLPPPPKSWAANPTNYVAVYDIYLPTVESQVSSIPLVKGANTSLYFVDGAAVKVEVVSLGGKKIESREFKSHCLISFDVDELIQRVADQHERVREQGDLTVCVSNISKGVAADKVPARLLWLQGKPIGEPVKSHGPFVMNTSEEIKQAFTDYQKTGFGGWPWKHGEMVFPRERGRFAKTGGKEIKPPKRDWNY